MNCNKTIDLSAVQTGATINIGVEGTYRVSSQVFDFSAWQQAYGEGTLTVLARRPGENTESGAPLFYEASNVTVDGTTATWEFDAVDAGIAGYGTCIVVYTVGGVRKAKTPDIDTFIQNSSADAGGGSPQPTGGDYNELSNKPSINGVTLEGNKTSAELDIDRTFVYQQGVASDTWTIPHNLGKYPSVTVVDSTGRVVVGGTQYLDSNTVVLTFSGAFSGVAYLN